MQWLAVALGGALGSVLRYALIAVTPAIGVSKFPLGVLAINLLGSFAIGIAYVVFVEYAVLSPVWRHFFIAGILGGFTTFSTFSLDIFQLMQSGFLGHAILYVVLSVGLGLLATFAGVMLTQRFF